MPSMPTPSPAVAPVAATFRAQHRGGGLYSELVSQRAGSWLALAGHRLRLTPTALTLLGLAVGVGASVVAVTNATRFSQAAGPAPAWGLGLLVGLAWQVAYAFDCADGQLARVTGRTSGAGARLDILADVATQISVVAAIVAVGAVQAEPPPAWLSAVFAGTWMVNLVTSVLAGGAAAGSLVPSTSPLVRAVKLVRDYGAVMAGVALVLTLLPGWTTWLMIALSVLNGGFLVASIVHAARASWGSAIT